MMCVIGLDERVGIGVGVDEEAAATDFLVEGVIDGERGAGDHIFVVHIRGDADDAAWPGADGYELHHGIGPHDVLIERVAVGEHFYRDTLADDDDFFGVFAIEVVEIAAFDDGDAEGGEESGRDGAELRVGILFAIGAHVALCGELEAGAEDTFVAPGNGGADGDAIYSGESGDLANGLFIEIEDLVGRASVGNDGNVDRENIVRVKTSAHGLQREKGFEQHAGAGEEHEAGGDLSDGEDAQASSGAAGDAHAAAGDAQAVRGVRGRKARDKCEKNRGDDCEDGTDPQHAGINSEIERADGKARSVAGEDRDHGAGDQNAECRAGAAEQEAID